MSVSLFNALVLFPMPFDSLSAGLAGPKGMFSVESIEVDNEHDKHWERE